MEAQRKRVAEENKTTTRSTRRAGFQFVPGDLDFLRLIHEYRFLRIEHLNKLTGRTYTRIHKRLKKLADNRYLRRKVLPQQKHIYSIGPRGLALLVREGILAPELLGDRLRTHELKDLFLRHEMMLVDIHVALALAIRGTEIRLAAWQEGQELWDSVEFIEQGRVQRLPVRPDAFFTLEHTGRPTPHNRVHLFLEADRSSTDHVRFFRKVKAYEHYIEQGLHAKRYSIETARILTIAEQSARAENLCAGAYSIVSAAFRKYFLFGSSRKLFVPEDPASILVGDLFLCPRDYMQNVRYSLLPH